MQNSSECQLQIKLITKQDSYVLYLYFNNIVIFKYNFFRYAVPDVPLSVPQTVDTKSLNDLVNQLLKESNSDFLKPKDFDFLVFDELLRVPLIEHLQERNVSTEVTVDVEYIERTPSPEPEDSLLHDDWVSSIHTADKW